MNAQVAVDLMSLFLYSSYLYFYLVNIKRLKCMFEQKCACRCLNITLKLVNKYHRQRSTQKLTHTNPIDLHSFNAPKKTRKDNKKSIFTHSIHTPQHTHTHNYQSHIKYSHTHYTHSQKQLHTHSPKIIYE